MTTEGPLAGIRVVEMAGIGPAPFAAMSLADMGADVIRVDRPTSPELGTAPPEADVLNRGKRSIVLDVKDPGQHAALMRLIDTADVLIEGMRPGVMERLGLGPDELLARNPRLVFVRLTGWGQDGPLADSAGHEINYLAVAGVLGTIGPAGKGPQVPPPMLGDYGGGGAYAVIGALAGLLGAARTGRGQVVDAAMTDGSAHLMAAVFSSLGAGNWRDARGTNVLDGGSPFYNVYETADGEWMSVGALERKFFAALLDRLGIGPEEFAPGDQYDTTQWDRLGALLRERFRSRTRAEWADHFAGSDACVAPVLGLRETAAHEHTRSRRSIIEGDGMIQPGLAPRFSSSPDATPGAPAVPGRHTREILEELGVDLGP